MPVTRRNRKNSRRNERKSRSSRRGGASKRNSKKGGYKMHQLWPRSRVIAFVNALTAKGAIANPGSVTESRGLDILAEVAEVSVDELKNNVNPITFGKKYLELSEDELEKGLLKGKSVNSFSNQMGDMRKELFWATGVNRLGNRAAFERINFGNVPKERPLRPFNETKQD